MSAIYAYRWIPLIDEDDVTRAYAPSAGAGLAVSIKERILRQLRTIAAAVTNVAAAYRWDVGRWHNGSAYIDTLARDSVEVVCTDDNLVEESMNGPLTKRAQVAVQIKLVRDSDDTTVYDSLVRRWENDLEKAIMADPFVTETSTSVRLATDSRILNLPGPATDRGQYEVVPQVIVEVDYRHDADNPSKLGTVITAVTE